CGGVMSDGKRLALIIAVSQYDDHRWPTLRAPPKDAEELSRVLGDADIGGFQVDVPTMTNLRDLRRKIAAFFDPINGPAPNDTLFVHFSCHAITDRVDNKFYFAASDTRVDELTATALEGVYVASLMKDCR